MELPMMKTHVAATIALAFFIRPSFAQQEKVRTWSSECTQDFICESSIINPGWHADGSGLFLEATSTSNASVVVGLSRSRTTFSVALFLGLIGTEPIVLNPMEDVRLETDSAPNMLLSAVTVPAPKKHTDDVTINKQFANQRLTIAKTEDSCGGYLHFPVDPDAQTVTVVVRIGHETFRFPFARLDERIGKYGSLDAKHRADTPASPSSAADSANPSTPPPRQSAPSAPYPGLNPLAASTFSTQTKGECSRNISFAVAENGQVSPRAPGFTQKWIQKNLKSYLGLCFSQAPNPSAINFLLVFSTAQTSFNGIYPTVRTNTQTNTTPVSGTGTVTDNSGSFWSYTYDGTVTSTSTTTTHENLPYTDTTRGLYLNAYSQQGTLLASRGRTVTTRQGGDSYNTLGYNLGSALAAIHIKERLLKDVVDAIAK
jgi:hypothetical protein